MTREERRYLYFNDPVFHNQVDQIVAAVRSGSASPDYYDPLLVMAMEILGHQAPPPPRYKPSINCPIEITPQPRDEW